MVEEGPGVTLTMEEESPVVTTMEGEGPGVAMEKPDSEGGGGSRPSAILGVCKDGIEGGIRSARPRRGTRQVPELSSSSSDSLSDFEDDCTVEDSSYTPPKTLNVQRLR